MLFNHTILASLYVLGDFRTCRELLNTHRGCEGSAIVVLPFLFCYSWLLPLKVAVSPPILICRNIEEVGHSLATFAFPLR